MKKSVNFYKIAFFFGLFLVVSFIAANTYTDHMDRAVERGKQLTKQHRILKARQRMEAQIANYKYDMAKDMNKSTTRLVWDRTVRWINGKM